MGVLIFEQCEVAYCDWLILNNMASDLNVNKTQILLNSVVFSNSLPDFWNPGTDKLTYGVLNELFKFVDENNLSSAVIKRAILLLCGRDISSEIKNVFNLKNSIKNFLRKSHDHNNNIYMKLYNNDNVVLPVVAFIFERNNT